MPTRRVTAAVVAAGALLLAPALAGCHSTTTVTLRGADVPAGAALSSPTAQASTPPAPSVPVAAARPARPKPVNPCAHNRSGQLVTVSLRAQHLWLCRARQVSYDTPITSGVVGQYTSTPTGHYTIQALERHQTLTLLDGSQYTVQYWIPFDAPLFGFHDSPWQRFPYGSPRYRTQGSHGCVHMPLAAIAHLYRWAHVGTKVYIHA